MRGPQGPRRPRRHTCRSGWWSTTPSPVLPLRCARHPGRPSPPGTRERRTRREGQGRRGGRTAPPPQGRATYPARHPGPARGRRAHRAAVPLLAEAAHRRLRRRRRLLRHLRLRHPTTAAGRTHAAVSLRASGPVACGGSCRRPRVVLLATRRGLAWLPSTQYPRRRPATRPRPCTQNWPARAAPGLPRREARRARCSTLVARRSRSSSTSCGRCSSRCVRWCVAAAHTGVPGSGLALVIRRVAGGLRDLTQSAPPAAYFVTHTRVWELGLGSLRALAVDLGWRLAPRRCGPRWAGSAGDQSPGRRSCSTRAHRPRHGCPPAHARRGPRDRRRDRRDPVVASCAPGLAGRHTSSATSPTRCTCGTGRSSSSPRSRSGVRCSGCGGWP